MAIFRAGRGYERKLDVRDHEDLLQLLEHGKPNGTLWPLVAARRAGKTWTLRALEHAMGKQDAHFIDLRTDGEVFDAEPQARCLLLDEPGPRLKNAKTAKTFIARCGTLHTRGIKLLLAMSPGEWGLLERADRASRRVDRKDLHYLDPLTATQAGAIAARAAWSAAILPGLPEPWRRHPFLLELVLEVAEKNPGLRGDIARLVEAALVVAGDASHFYVKAVFHNGLSNMQRQAVRDAARRHAVGGEACELLRRCHLLEGQPRGFRLSDPILADHLPPPLRIHHISDIHVGDKAAASVDVKAKGSVGERLGEGVKAGLVRDAYLDHVRALANPPHLVVVSGDIAERGDPALYAEIQGWFATLRTLLAEHPHLGPDDPRVLVVGGNHDVDWGQALGVEGARRRHRPFAEAFEGVPRPSLERPPEDRPLAAVDYPDLGVSFLLLGSAEFGGEVEEDPERKRLLGILDELRRQVVDAKDLDEAAAFLDRMARIDPGLVHKADLDRARGVAWLLPVRIAVLHHPVSPMPATEVAHFAGLINAGQVKDMLLARHFGLVLHGHMHVGWFASERWPGRHADWTLRIASAPTLGSRETDEQHGFNEVEVVREGGDYAVTVRTFRRKGDTWELQNQMGPFTPGAATTMADAARGETPPLVAVGRGSPRGPAAWGQVRAAAVPREGGL
jgi:3',5'-cyclic AMP phosphodiesterase CpdA